MNAHKFVAEHGIEEAKEIINDPLHPQMTHVSNDGRHWVNAQFESIPEIKEQMKNMLKIAEIRQVVESVDLIKTCGGLELAKEQLLTFAFIESDKFPFLQKSITDYELIYGAKE